VAAGRVLGPGAGVPAGVFVRVWCGVRIRKVGAHRLATGPVDTAERADPPEVPGLGLGECPAAVLVRVVAFAGRADVDLDGVPAQAVVPGVVQVRAPRRTGAPRATAVPVADADVLGERTAGEPGVRVRVESVA
jgi:hypothetical protein